MYTSILWDGKSFYQYYYSPHLEAGRRSLLIITLRKYLKDNKLIKEPMGSIGNADAMFMGQLAGDVDRVDAVLREAGSIFVRKGREKIGGFACYVIEGVTKRGKYTVWLDPRHGYNIAQAKVERRPGDVVSGSDYEIQNKERLSFSFGPVRFKRVDGVWVPMEADAENSRYFPPGTDLKDFRHKFHHRRTEVILNPDHNKLDSFVPKDIKNGSSVDIVDVQGRYRWEDGRVVDAEGLAVDLDKLTVGKKGKGRKRNLR